MAAHRTKEQVEAHEKFRAELEALYGTKKPAAKKAAESKK